MITGQKNRSSCRYTIEHVMWDVSCTVWHVYAVRDEVLRRCSVRQTEIYVKRVFRCFRIAMLRHGWEASTYGAFPRILRPRGGYLGWKSCYKTCIRFSQRESVGGAIWLQLKVTYGNMHLADGVVNRILIRPGANSRFYSHEASIKIGMIYIFKFTFFFGALW